MFELIQSYCMYCKLGCKEEEKYHQECYDAVLDFRHKKQDKEPERKIKASTHWTHYNIDGSMCIESITIVNEDDEDIIVKISRSTSLLMSCIVRAKTTREIHPMMLKIPRDDILDIEYSFLR